MDEYGQYCAVSKAAEVVDQRWTLLVIRELLDGKDRFNDIHRGLPRMSRTLLSRRLTSLVQMGLVDRREGDEGPIYELTEIGQELEPIVEAFGRWAVRWTQVQASDALDPIELIWDMHLGVDRTALPDGRTVVMVSIRDVEPDVRDWWFVLTPHEVDVCDYDPGYGVDVSVESSIHTLSRVWKGDIGWSDAIRGDLDVGGPEHLRRRVDNWFQLGHRVPSP